MRDVIERARAALEEGRAQDALAILEPCAFASSDAEAVSDLGAVYARLGWEDEAEALLRRAVRLDPAFARARSDLVALLLRRGLPHSAVRLLREGLEAARPDGGWRAQLEDLERRHPVARVSVYTPGFASEPFVERCVKAIHAQTYPVEEVIVVDDKSPDRSTEIALRCGARVFYHDRNRGLAASTNTALARCRGEFFAKLDTDVEADPTWLERAMSRFDTPEIAGAGGPLIEHRTTSLADEWRQVHMAQQHWGDRPLWGIPLIGAACVFRTSALRAAGGWSETFQAYGEDMELAKRLLESGRQLVYEPSATVRHLRRDTVGSVLRGFWSWWLALRPESEGPGAYDCWWTTLEPEPKGRGLDGTAACARRLDFNSHFSWRTLGGCSKRGRADLSYPCFLLFPAWGLFDLRHAARTRPAEAAAAAETAIGLLSLLRYRLARSCAAPPALIERTVDDLLVLARAWIPAGTYGSWLEPGGLERALPLALDGAAASARLVSVLPRADPGYLRVVATHSWFEQPERAGGALEVSVERLAREEVRAARAAPRRWVILNPADRRRPPASSARLRWLRPSRIREAASRLRAAGVDVEVVDAPRDELDERAAVERVLGAEPDVVVLSAEEGDLERLAMAARSWKLRAGSAARVVLAGAGALALEPAGYPMFDAVFAGWPEPDGAAPEARAP